MTAIPGAPDPRGLGGGVSRGQGPNRPPGAGAAARSFRLPGRVVEVSETLAAALAAELMEEVSVAAEIAAFNRHVEVVAHEGSRIRAHFVIAPPVGRGAPRPSDEVDTVDWIDPSGLSTAWRLSPL